MIHHYILISQLRDENDSNTGFRPPEHEYETFLPFIASLRLGDGEFYNFWICYTA